MERDFGQSEHNVSHDGVHWAPDTTQKHGIESAEEVTQEDCCLRREDAGVQAVSQDRFRPVRWGEKEVRHAYVRSGEKEVRHA